MRRSFGVGALLTVLAVVPASARDTPPPAVAEFTLPAGSGTLSLADFRGKVVLVDFWASWCVPCRRSFPWLRDVAERYRDRGLVVVAINLDKDRSAADAFLSAFTTPFYLAYDPNGRSAEAFGVSAMPSSFVVARDGRVAFSIAGFDPRDAADTERRIEEVLAR